MFKNPFYRDVAKATLVVILTVALTRLSLGVFFGVIGILGAVAVFRQKPGSMVAWFLMIPFLMMMNRVILPSSSLAAAMARIGQMVMVVAIMCQTRLLKGSIKLPLGFLFLYSLWAFVSSTGGWFPLISYLKLINFVFFFAGLAFALRQMQKSEADLRHVRAFLMAIAFIMIVGSFVTRFVPSVGFSMVTAKSGGEYIEAVMQERLAQEGVRLFNGMTWHSQCLAPIVALCSAWVMCDMMLIERGVTSLHLLLIAMSPVLLYWTSSRTGLMVFAFAMGVIWLFMLPKAPLAPQVKKRMQGLFTLFCVLVALAAGVVEIRSGTMSRWLRKTTQENQARDNRGLVQAVTESRQGLIELNLYDYRQNPLCGMGFQVMAWHKIAYQQGAITLFSAPIEKGVLPLMILGETGIVGAVIFVFFLISFTGQLLRKRCVVTVTLFWAMLVSNMAEATFFSPSGTGGILWCVCGIGGMCIDVLVLRSSRRTPWPQPVPPGVPSPWGPPPMAIGNVCPPDGNPRAIFHR